MFDGSPRSREAGGGDPRSRETVEGETKMYRFNPSRIRKSAVEEPRLTARGALSSVIKNANYNSRIPS